MSVLFGMLFRLAILLALLIPLPFLSCAPAKPPIMNLRSNAVKIEFKRSGGFSPITNASGTVEFKGSSAEVTSQSAGYHRSLAPDEAASLQTLSSPESVAGVQSATSPVRDGFKYQITIKTADGQQHTLDSSAQKLTPSGSRLVQWVQQESQKILAHRAGGS